MKEINDFIEKTASLKARLIESAIGAGIGSSIGGIAGAVKDKEHRFKSAFKGALTGAGIGAVGAPFANKAVGVGTKVYKKINVDDVASKVKGKAQKNMSDVYYGYDFKKGSGNASHLSYEDALKKDTSKAKEDIIGFRRAVYNKAGRKMAGKKTGMLDGMFDSIDDLHAETGYRSSRNPKGFARDMSEKYAPDKSTEKNYVKSMRDYLNESRAENKKDKNSIIRNMIKTKEANGVNDLKDIFSHKQVVNAYSKKYVKGAEEAANVASKNHKDIVFGNIRNFSKDKKDIDIAKTKLKGLKKNLDDYSNKENDINTYNYKRNPLLNENEANKDFNRHYRNIRQDVKSKVKNESRKAYGAAKEDMGKRYKKWNDRANMADSGPKNSSSYDWGGKSSSYGFKYGKDPREILKGYEVDFDSVKTKAEVDRLKRVLAKKYHPDVNKASDATAKMQKAMNDMDDIKKTDWYEKLSFWVQRTMEK